MEALQAKCTPSLPYRLVLRMFKLLAIYISKRHPDSRYNVIVSGIKVNPVGTWHSSFRSCSLIHTVLSNKHMLADQPHIEVNADLSVSDCKARSILLHKHYELFRFGVDCHSIRLHYNSLLVGGRKYGSIVNQSFELCHSQGHTTLANSPGYTPQHGANSTGVSPAASDDTST